MVATVKNDYGYVNSILGDQYQAVIPGYGKQTGGIVQKALTAPRVIKRSHKPLEPVARNKVQLVLVP